MSGSCCRKRCKGKEWKAAARTVHLSDRALPAQAGVGRRRREYASSERCRTAGPPADIADIRVAFHPESAAAASIAHCRLPAALAWFDLALAGKGGMVRHGPNRKAPACYQASR